MLVVRKKLLYLWVAMHLHIHALGRHEKLMTMKRFFAFFLVPVLSFAVCSNTPVVGLRTGLNVPDVPFVAGQLAPEFKNAPYFNPEIIKIGDVIDNAYCATSEDCLTIDQTHFDRNSLIKMGERYADIIFKQVYGK